MTDFMAGGLATEARRHGEEDKRSTRWPAKQATSSGTQTADERRKASTASSFVRGLPCPNRRCAAPRRTPLWLCVSVAKRSSSGLRVFVATVFRGSAARVHPSPGAAFVSSRASASRGSGAGRDRLLAPDPGSRRGRGRFAVLPY